MIVKTCDNDTKQAWINLTVREMYDTGWNFTFRRWLNPSLQNQMAQLRSVLLTVALGEDKDKPKWKYAKNGKFSVKSKMSSPGPDRSFRHLWKAKIPLKIKVWLWLTWHNAIATKEQEDAWTGDDIYVKYRMYLNFSYTC